MLNQGSRGVVESSSLKWFETWTNLHCHLAQPYSQEGVGAATF